MKERQNIAWKKTWRDQYLRWICVFANADGDFSSSRRRVAGRAVSPPCPRWATGPLAAPLGTPGTRL